jgi:hypothetical protein
MQRTYSSLVRKVHKLEEQKKQLETTCGEKTDEVRRYKEKYNKAKNTLKGK